MNLSFDRMLYDIVNDKPTVILKNEEGKELIFRISEHTALEIDNFKHNIHSTHSNMKNIINDLFKISESRIEKITIEKRDGGSYNGYLSLKNNGNIYCYYLNIEDLILCSILFDKPVNADPLIFFDFPESVQNVMLSKKQDTNVNSFE